MKHRILCLFLATALIASPAFASSGSSSSSGGGASAGGGGGGHGGGGGGGGHSGGGHGGGFASSGLHAHSAMSAVSARGAGKSHWGVSSHHRHIGRPINTGDHDMWQLGVTCPPLTMQQGRRRASCAAPTKMMIDERTGAPIQ